MIVSDGVQVIVISYDACGYVATYVTAVGALKLIKKLMHLSIFMSKILYPHFVNIFPIKILCHMVYTYICT